MPLSWLYFSLSIASLVFTVNALRPLKWEPICAFTFFAGWFTSELPLVHILWQAAGSALFLWAGAAHHWPGSVGIAICGISWLGLGFLEIASLRTGSVMELCMHDVIAATPDHVPTPIRWHEARLPVPRRGLSVERIRNVDYWGDAIPPHRLDIYRPRADGTSATETPGAPVLFYIHGGAWIVGDKREQGLPLMHHMARRGWVCVSANYRLSPRATWPDHIVDVKRALAWIREHISDYGGDPSCVVVSGGSAGGHLAALVALTANDPSFQPGFESSDTSVSACVPFYGVYDFTNDARIFSFGMTVMLERYIFKKKLAEHREDFEAASPYCRIHADAPRFLIVAGRNDTLVPIAEARRFASQLSSVSRQDVCYAEIPFAQHAFEIFPSVRTSIVTRAVERFLVFAAAQRPAPPGESRTGGSPEPDGDKSSAVAAGGFSDG